MWNLLCQYNNIYEGSYKYLKGKTIQTKDWSKKRKKYEKDAIVTIATVPLEQTKNTVTFTHSPNKCYNIFTKHLFSVMVSHSFIFIILFWLIRNWHLNNCENIVKFVVSV